MENINKNTKKPSGNPRRRKGQLVTPSSRKNLSMNKSHINTYSIITRVKKLEILQGISQIMRQREPTTQNKETSHPPIS